MHVDEAEARGIARTTIAAIARGSGRTDDGGGGDRPRLLGELHAKQAVSDATYARAVAAFGESGVVDLTAVAGYYTTLAMILNVARTPVPPGERSPLAELLGKPMASRARRSLRRGLAPLRAEPNLDRVQPEALRAFSTSVSVQCSCTRRHGSSQ